MKSYLEINSDFDGRIVIVDYLKGFAIFTIALMHLLFLMSEIPSKIITLSLIGGTGAHVFFVCSGMGLYTSYLKHRTSFADFLRKRFLKIYIPYIIIVLLSFFIPWMYDGDDKVSALLSHIFFYKMFVPKYEESFGGHFWFISTIFQLYVLFIPMCRIKEKINNSYLFVLLFSGISVAWWVFCYSTGIDEIRIWGSFCLQYIWEFALGFILAEAFYKQKHFIVSNGLLLVLAVSGMGLQAWMTICPGQLKVFNDIPALIGYTSFSLLLSHSFVVKLLCVKLSVISYEFYLMHILIFVTVFYLMNPQILSTQCIVGIVAMAASLGIAFLYNRFIGFLRVLH